jgi:hypothetical protein
MIIAVLNIDYLGYLVYNTPMEPKKCNVNPIVKYIRIILSLAVIGLGIYHHNWLGILGLFTLYTALTGKCSASLRFTRRPNFKLEQIETLESKKPGS